MHGIHKIEERERERERESPIDKQRKRDYQEVAMAHKYASESQPKKWV